MARVNWLGFPAGALIVYLVIFDRPWWLLEAGGVAKVAISPFNVVITFLGQGVLVPAVYYVTWAAKLTAVAAAAALFISSAAGDRGWSRRVMGFAWTKMPAIVIGLVAILVLASYATYFVGLPQQVSYSVPLAGVGRLSASFNSFSITATLTSNFTEHFMAAVVAAALSIAARLYHGRLGAEKAWKWE